MLIKCWILMQTEHCRLWCLHCLSPHLCLSKSALFNFSCFIFSLWELKLCCEFLRVSVKCSLCPVKRLVSNYISQLYRCMSALQLLTASMELISQMRLRSWSMICFSCWFFCFSFCKKQKTVQFFLKWRKVMCFLFLYQMYFNSWKCKFGPVDTCLD